MLEGLAGRVAVLTLVCAVLVSIGCQDDVATEFPAGLEPLEDNMAPAPPAGSEELVTVEGGDERKWVHGRGYVRAAPAAVWAALKDANHVIADCATDRHAVEPSGETYEYGFRVHYEVDEVVTVAWDELWRFGTVTGTPDAPELAMIRYQKVFGSDFITTLEGAVMLKPASDVTELAFVEHLQALGGNHDDMKMSMRQRFAIAVAVVHGQPLPPCP